MEGVDRNSANRHRVGALKVIWECNLSSYDALMVITHGIFFR